MANTRYVDKKIQLNDEEVYEEYFRQRGIRFARQYATSVVNYPSEEELEQIEIVNHVWSVGDRFYKLASEHYKDPTLWWVIAWFNQKPTESHVSLGDVVEIPFPLSFVLKIARF